MRHFRNLLYFFLGCILSAWVVFAHAETIAASSGKLFYHSRAATCSTSATACDYTKAVPEGCQGMAAYLGTTYASWSGTPAQNAPYYFICNWTSGGSYSIQMSAVSGYYCPSGQNWTLSGSSCTRPDCTAPSVRQSDGTCSAPCPVYDGSDHPELTSQPSGCSCPAGTSWFYGGGCRKTCDSSQPDGGVANAGFGIAIADGATTGCFQGCQVQHSAGAYDQYKGYKMATATWAHWACDGTGLGTAPTPNNQPTPDSQSQDPNKPPRTPPCAAGDGVITSSSGGVKCLPEGTPNTSPPNVGKTTKTETFPDGSTRTETTTTTRDPNTNATSTTVTVTSTGGQSGTAGTTTSNTGTTGSVGSGNGTGDGDGNCDPQKSACSNGAGDFGSNDNLYKKKYENGLSGVLTEKYEAMMDTPIFGLVSQLAPTNIGGGGSCPHWSFSGAVNSKISLGGMDFSPPCWVFDACRAILIVTSLLLARRLIFGG